MSWKKIGGIDYSKFSNNIHSNLSNFTMIETLKINSNNTSLHIGSNTLRIGNNTGETNQYNSIWFGGLDLDNNISMSVEDLPRTSLEEKYFRSEYIGSDTKKELFVYKGDTLNDRIRLKSSNIVFDTFEESVENINYPADRYTENIRMIINNKGDVGINTLTPRTKLDVNGQLISGYGSGINGNNTIFELTGDRNPLISNGYYYCGTLGIAYDYSSTDSANNNSKLKVEIFGGDMTSTSGMGIDTFVISNNIIINDINNKENLHAIIYKSSTCGGAGYDANNTHTNDLYKLCIYRNKETGKDDVYIYIRGYKGTTINIRSFLISNNNKSMNYMDEQFIELKYQSSDNSDRPDTAKDNDDKILYDAVYGPKAEVVKYFIKYGFIEKYNGKFGLGTNTFNSDTDFGVIFDETDIALNGNTELMGNLKIDENVHIAKDLKIDGKIYLNGEMNVNSVVMQNYQILEHAYIGGGLTLNTNQLVDIPNGDPEYRPNLNTILFDNQTGVHPSTPFKISQIDEYIKNDNKQYNFLSITRGTIDDYYDYADICIVGDSGKIGMGLTTPQNKLDINGSLCVGNNYAGQFTTPENGALIEGSVGIGATSFPSSGATSLRVGGNAVIGKEYSLLSSIDSMANGMIIQSALGVGIRNPTSILDIGGALTFGDGSKQSYAVSFLGAKSNGIWSEMGTRGKNIFDTLNDKYSIKNKTSSRFVVDCNNNGSIMVIGCEKSTVNNIDNVGNVTVYTWSGMKWSILGNTLIGNVNNKDKEGNIVGERFGRSVSISGKGHTIIVGAANTCNNNLDYCGRISVYAWANSNWSEISTFYGEEENIYIGSTTCISKLGNYISFGGNNINYIYYGELEADASTSTLVPLKITNTSETNNTNKFGCSLSITREGGILIVGSCGANVQGVNAGCVYVYVKQLEDNKLLFSDDYYIKVVSPEPVADQGFGAHVSMNSVGNNFAVSSPDYSTNESNKIGSVYVYNLLVNSLINSLYKDSENSNLVSITGSLYGTVENQRFGTNLNLNGSGEYLIVTSSGDTIVPGRISMYHYDTTASWLFFSESYAEPDITLPGSTMGVSSDSTIVVYGYDQILEGESFNCANVIRLGSYENTLTTESSIIKSNITIGNTNPSHPVDILETKDKNVLSITANIPVQTTNDEGIDIDLLDQYEGGILLQNDLGGNTTYFLKNKDTNIQNNTGTININYQDSINICQNDTDKCTLHASSGKVSINHNNPVSSLDILGSLKLHDGNFNLLMSSDSFNELEVSFSGFNNSSYGQRALYNLETGSYNVGIGFNSGYKIKDGNNNIAIGNQALAVYDCKDFNIAIGTNALTKNSQNNNVAIGYNALKDDVHGKGNTAIGSDTNVDGIDNWQYSTAVGYKAVIGKSDSIILGDSTNDQLCVGIGTNSPSTRLDIVGGVKISETLVIQDILYPKKGININDNFIIDVVNNTTTVKKDLIVENDTTLNTLVITDFCKPNKGININNGDCIIGLGGYSSFGKLGISTSNSNNPLITSNGFVQINNSMDVTGTISAARIQTNSLIFIDLFEPNGGIAMFPPDSKTDPIFYVQKNSGNTYINGNFSVDGSCAFNSGFSSSGSDDSIFHNDIIANGALTCANNKTIFANNSVVLSDGRTTIELDDFTDMGPGIKISANESNMVIKQGVSKVTVEGDLQVNGIIEASNIQGGGAIPIGGIIMWAGSETTVPVGWSICNGLNNTPDLRGRFIMGSTGGETIQIESSQDNQYDNIYTDKRTSLTQPYTQGGYASVGITEDQMPTHNHDITQSDHKHNLTGIEEHKHEVDLKQFVQSGYINAYGQGSGPYSSNGSLSQSQQTSELIPLAEGDQDKENLFQLTTVQTVTDGANAAYALTVSKWNNNVRTANRADKISLQVEPTPATQLGFGITEVENPKINGQSTDTQEAIININEKGKSQRFENRPPYFVLAYIMRIQ
jgi:hypothetical protein